MYSFDFFRCVFCLIYRKYALLGKGRNGSSFVTYVSHQTTHDRDTHDPSLLWGLEPEQLIILFCVSALSTDGACAFENWDHYVLSFSSMTEDEAERVFSSINTWAEPNDQQTIEDRYAAWNYCVGQFAIITLSFPSVRLFKVMLGYETLQTP